MPRFARHDRGSLLVNPNEDFHKIDRTVFRRADILKQHSRVAGYPIFSDRLIHCSCSGKFGVRQKEEAAHADRLLPALSCCPGATNSG